MLYGVISRIVSDENIGKEVLQDCFLKIWDRISTYDANKARLATWMINIARNSAIDKTRSKEYSQLKKTDSDVNFVYENTIQRSVQTKEEEIGVSQWLDLLDEDHRLIFELFYFKGFTQSEITKNYHVPLGTVKTRLRNGLMKLRKHLNIS
ncbi:MAG: RNA polymerase sigma factor (sigma-70 family) [Cyclobacteriaceae bacterium]|jgi:RNA polymerase sigma factor (sigma-70 family)